MTLLITGANGQVGWELARQSEEGGFPAVALTRDQLDISDAAAVVRAFERIKPTLVINAAAYTSVDKAENEREKAFSVNRDGPGHLAGACVERGIPLIHISTDYVFDGERSSPYSETDPVSPLGVYGQSKWEGEEAIRNVLDDHIIIRTSWVFGSHGNNFVKTVLRLAKNGGPLRIVNDQHGAPTSAQSIASCILQLVRNHASGAGQDWGTYHFSGTPHTTWHGFATEIVAQASQLGLIEPVMINPITTAEFPTSARRPKNSRLDTSKIKATDCPLADWRADLGIVLKAISS